VQVVGPGAKFAGARSEVRALRERRRGVRARQVARSGAGARPRRAWKTTKASHPPEGCIFEKRKAWDREQPSSRAMRRQVGDINRLHWSAMPTPDGSTADHPSANSPGHVMPEALLKVPPGVPMSVMVPSPPDRRCRRRYRLDSGRGGRRTDARGEAALRRQESSPHSLAKRSATAVMTRKTA